MIFASVCRRPGHVLRRGTNLFFEFNPLALKGEAPREACAYPFSESRGYRGYILPTEPRTSPTPPPSLPLPLRSPRPPFPRRADAAARVQSTRAGKSAGTSGGTIPTNEPATFRGGKLRSLRLASLLMTPESTAEVCSLRLEAIERDRTLVCPVEAVS